MRPQGKQIDLDFSSFTANNPFRFDVSYTEPFLLVLDGALNFVQLNNTQTAAAGTRRMTEHGGESCPDGQFLEKDKDTTIIPVMEGDANSVFVGCDEDSKIVVTLVTLEQTPEPTHSPSAKPSHEPSSAPSIEPSISSNPSTAPTSQPSLSVEPTKSPTAEPTMSPTPVPTRCPTPEPVLCPPTYCPPPDCPDPAPVPVERRDYCFKTQCSSHCFTTTVRSTDVNSALEYAQNKAQNCAVTFVHNGMCSASCNFL